MSRPSDEQLYWDIARIRELERRTAQRVSRISQYRARIEALLEQYIALGREQVALGRQALSGLRRFFMSSSHRSRLIAAAEELGRRRCRLLNEADELLGEAVLSQYTYDTAEQHRRHAACGPDDSWILYSAVGGWKRYLETVQRDQEALDRWLRLELSKKEGVLQRRASRRHRRTLEGRPHSARSRRDIDHARSSATSIGKRIPVTPGCPYCGGDIGPSPHLDHILPLSLGGLSIPQNLVWVCAICNARKSNSTLNEFLVNTGYSVDVVKARLRSLGKAF